MKLEIEKPAGVNSKNHDLPTGNPIPIDKIVQNTSRTNDWLDTTDEDCGSKIENKPRRVVVVGAVVANLMTIMMFL